MQNPFANTGTQFFISASLPATDDAAGFNALTFTKIRGVASFADLGGAYELIDFNVIGGLRHRKRSGLLAQSLPLDVVNLTDAGQDLLAQAFTSPNSYSYKIIDAEGKVYYFTAECVSRYKNIGDPTSIADIKVILEINSAILEI
jgi:hypothetical protein